MATTARTRKTAKAASEEAPAEASAPETDILLADSAPAAPDAAPLEPPHVDESPEPPAPSPYVTPTEVIPDEENLSDIILDDATGQPPADVDAVFVPLTPFGSTLQCTIRLVERTFLGPHHNPVTRLLQPKGAVVSEGIAARIRERLDAQAARTSTNQ
ncbi:hypothetical protein [Streptomyces griseocarneus]|uniref:hypothetical protein n=1 Tax=Streptomyces griseocarneus TaxID=51201 RepID=UPI00167ECBE9|nr:hypothetical protein [Streptomyces griseocarneus]MBZ6476668.1 hypothetical protein [Streptomyces griseocarneus]GHG80216.1 hypothetical protein GCM10018779_61610 [Streptomyces griseocarneus]